MKELTPRPIENRLDVDDATLPWGPISSVLVTIGIYFASQIFGAVLIIIFPILFGWSSQQTTEWLDTSVIAQFLTVLIIEVFALLLLWWFMKHRKAKASQIGLVRPKWRDMVYALLGFGCYFLINVISIVIVSKFLPSIDTSQKQELGFSTTTSGLDLIFVFASLVILPPIVEEIVTRGFLYTGLASKLPKLLAAVITSVLFAMAHLQFGSGNGLLWVAAIDTFILSMVLVYLREKTDSLWSPFAVHFMKNALAFMAIFVFKVV